MSVSSSSKTLPHRGSPQADPSGENLLHKVRIKGDSEHYDWLLRELEGRYNYQCCDTMEEFQRAARGLTRNGQIKAGRHRHDKDDRHKIDDHRRYILGWTNQEKILALEQEAGLKAEELTQHTALLTSHRTRVRAQNERRDVLLNLTQNYPVFGPLDFASSSSRLQELRREYQELKARSGEVAKLQDRIDRLHAEVETTRQASDQLAKVAGRLENESLRLADAIHHALRHLGQSGPNLEIDPENPDVPAIVIAFRNLETIEQSASPALAASAAPWTEVRTFTASVNSNRLSNFSTALTARTKLIAAGRPGLRTFASGTNLVPTSAAATTTSAANFIPTAAVNPVAKRRNLPTRFWPPQLPSSLASRSEKVRTEASASWSSTRPSAAAPTRVHATGSASSNG